ncbi:uncharacterized protein [Rutidosis leptorrhynchoides]|uniref:uncharacterized protein n=1 Tax=Rutidosis leptorrhynchoides TaxID=125765 RepID=UPI003A99EF76
MFNIRHIIHPHIFHKIGNGEISNAWFDQWNSQGAVIDIVSRRNIVRQGDSLKENVCDIVNGNLKDFSVSVVWETIRPHASHVSWYKLVWFGQCIPRHAFIAWLLMGERLKTQDKLKSWERNLQLNANLVCALCKVQPDSHDHLFFNCPVSQQILFGTLVYYLWQERNNRLYGKKARSVDHIFEIVFSTVRMKLMSLKFRDSPFVREMKDNWKVP